jgi:putative membrane protein
MPTDSPAAEAAPGSTTTPPPEPPPAYERLSEAQLAKVTELVSRAELDQSRLALRAAQAAETKRFAAKMIEQHSAALREQARLVKKLGLTPADSTTAAKVKTEADAALRKLESADKTGFDAAYVNSQIEGHRKVLELLDAQLVPAASTPEVSEALRRARSALEQHLSEARALKVD